MNWPKAVSITALAIMGTLVVVAAPEHKSVIWAPVIAGVAAAVIAVFAPE